MQFICLLRGINVGGNNRMKMQELRELLTKMGLEEIQTYIQSGNIVFSSDESETKLEKLIHAEIEKAFGMSIEVFVRQPSHFEKALKNCPLDAKKIPHNRLMITFFSEVPEAERRKAIEAMDHGEDQIHFHEDFFYFYSPEGYGKSKLSNNFLESKLKVRATTRNWRTVETLLGMVKEEI